jgi:RNA polymerase sigma-70 factor (ECF subfamily)
LEHHDAEEIAQEVIIEVAGKMKEFRYDRSKGSFRAWLRNLTRWRVNDWRRKRNPARPNKVEVDGDEAHPAPVELLADTGSADWETMFDLEYKRKLFELALKRVRLRAKATHFQVFDLCERRQWPCAKVAATLGMSVPNVYLIKFRVLAMVKLEVRRVEKEMARANPPSPCTGQ